MFDRSINSKLRMVVLVACICLDSSNPVVGQDVAQLAVRARYHLYETWNFDSVAYYLNQVIGEKYAPAFAYADYGWYLMFFDRMEEGLTYIEQAAEMALDDPANTYLLYWYAEALMFSGDLPEAKRWVNKSLAIDPTDAWAWHISSRISSEMENHQEALKLAENAASKDPKYRAGIPWVLAKAGKYELAIEWAEKIAQDEHVDDAILLMEVYAMMKHNEKALEYIQKSYELRHPAMPWINKLVLFPSLEHLHDDPRFKDIIRKMKLPE